MNKLLRKSANGSSHAGKLLLAALATAAFVGAIAATPAMADPHHHHGRWDRHYHPGWVRYYDGPYVYYAPPPAYYPPPPPPVYYAPPPPPPPVYYGGPSLNVVIPIR